MKFLLVIMSIIILGTQCSDIEYLEESFDPHPNVNAYYVATNGDDYNTGTYQEPFATLQRAINVMSAGDTVYVRGGTYTYMSDPLPARSIDVYNKHHLWILNFPGEKPVFDFIGKTPPSYVIGFCVRSSDHIYIRGMTVKNVDQARDGSCYGFVIYDSHYCIFDQCVSSYNGGPGFSMQPDPSSSHNTFKNCDSHHNDNYNRSNYPHGMADGFVWNKSQITDTNYYTGCRSWNNSDDGFDFQNNEGVVFVDSCWAFWNGFDDDFNHLGDGVGFKFGDTQRNTNEIIRYFSHCLAYDNYAYQFDDGEIRNRIQIYNSHSYGGESGFRLDESIAHTVRNCISWNAWRNNWNLRSTTTADHNSGAAESDFVSVNHTGITGARVNGILPDIDFLKLAEGSNLIDAGIDVGVPFNGNAPDLGIYEKE